MRIRIYLLSTLSILLFTLILPLQLKAQTAESFQQLDQLLEQLNTNQQFNGTLLYAVNGDVRFHRSFGFAAPDKQRPITDQTSFRLASVSKQFIGVGIVLLEERGQLEYDDPINKYLPELNYPGVTIRHLLHHTGGLPDYISWMEEHWDVGKAPQEKSTVFNKDIVSQFAEHQPPAVFKPGEKFEYSNTGYALLGEIIIRVSGQNIQTFFQKNIFEPLGMTNSRAFSTDDRFELADRAYGFFAAPDGSEFIDNDWNYLNGVVGDGGIYSSALDLLKWDQALYTNQIISLASIQRAFTPGRLNDGSSTKYGFGWGVKLDWTYNRKVVSHSGAWVGFHTFIRRELGPKRVLIVLTNNTANNLMTVVSKATEILKGIPVAMPLKPISIVFAKTLAKDGLEAATIQYQELRQHQDTTFDFSEPLMNRLGYYYLKNKNDPATAAAIFSLNAETHPDNANPYDSWGEALLAQGDTANAIEQYKKSLQLNPGNTNAEKTLKQLKVEVSEVVKKVKLTAKLLEEYVGIYALSPSFKIEISREGRQLFIQATGQSRYEVYGQSKNRFYLKVVDAAISFHRNAEGKVDRLILHQGGVDQVGMKE